jgi:dihydrofolate reductase
MTREQVFLGLKIKKAELLPSGEVRLGNGKIMGHRQFHYIYKQKPRLPDDREAVVINKIALEYRKLRALQNGGKGDSLYPNQLTKKEFKEVQKERFKYEKNTLKNKMQWNKL